MLTNNQNYLNELINAYKQINLRKKENNNENILLDITILNPDKIKKIDNEEIFNICFSIRKIEDNKMPQILSSITLNLPNNKESKISLINFIEYLVNNNEIQLVTNYANTLLFSDDFNSIFFLPEIHTTDSIKITLPLNDLSYINCVTKANNKALTQRESFTKQLQILKEEYVPTTEENKTLLQKI